MTHQSDSIKHLHNWTIFFDVGGVLLDDFIELKTTDLALKYGKEPAALLLLRKKMRPLADAGKISDSEFWRSLLRESGVEAVEEDCEIDQYMRPIKEGLDLACRLKQNGYRLAILSNDSKEMFQRKRELFGFDSLFKEIIVSSDYGVIKPNPGLYRIALRRMKVKSQEAIFIDDRPENLVAAEKLGMRTIQYQSAGQAEMELKKMGIDLPPLIAT
jgi:putative hydrolase of the HAD superfamily